MTIIASEYRIDLWIPGTLIWGSHVFDAIYESFSHDEQDRLSTGRYDEGSTNKLHYNDEQK